MSPKKKLEARLKEQLPSLITDIRNGDSSKREELAVLLLPYVKLLTRKYQQILNDSLNSLAGWIVARIISKIENIDLSKSPIGYIARSSINYCIDMCRKRNKSIEKTAKSFDKLSYDELYTNSQNSYIEDIDSIKFYLEQTFTPSDAKIVGLFYLENKTPSEISAVTGQPLNEVQETIDLAREFVLK